MGKRGARMAMAGGWLIAAAVLLGGCATLFADSTRDVRIVTVPAGAEVSVNGESVGTGVKRVRVPNDEPATFMAELPDHAPVIVEVGTRFNKLTWWNLINIYGWIIDLATGSMWELETSSVVLKLPEKERWSPPPGNFVAPPYPVAPAAPVAAPASPAP